MTKKLQFYTKNINEITSHDKLLSTFTKNLLITNRSHEFYVDWKKVIDNTSKLKYELNLLNSLIDSDDFENDFYDLVENYPEVVEALPILLAVRDLEIIVIEDFSNPDINLIEYNFNKKKDKLNGFMEKSEQKDEIIKRELIYSFILKTGLKKLFYNVKNLFDYVFGVEVGLDTNARKNRSGKSMEILIEPILNGICKKYGIKLYVQKKFKDIKDQKIEFPASLKNRKNDFILIKNNQFINIEVNFYRGSGSKPEEIVDSYINRYHELKRKNGFFIWITDGEAWKTSHNQIAKGFDKLPYLFNIYFVRKGLLEQAIKEIFT